MKNILLFCVDSFYADLCVPMVTSKPGYPNPAVIC